MRNNQTKSLPRQKTYARLFGLLNALYFTLAIILIGGIRPLRAQNETKSETEARIVKEKARRAVTVNSVNGGVGISSGVVVAYGHPIAPPYHFEYRGPLLFLNGVQVEPSLVLQKEYDKNRHEMTADQKDAWTQLAALKTKAQGYYADRAGKVPNTQLHDELLAMVRAHPKVKDAKWMNDEVLIYFPKGQYENVAQAIGFSTQTMRMPPKPSQEKLKQEHIQELELQLKNGDCIFWGTIGAWHNPAWACGNIKVSVRQIMEQPSLSDHDKETKLHNVFGGDKEQPLDIMANYNSSEWK